MSEVGKDAMRQAVDAAFEQALWKVNVTEETVRKALEAAAPFIIAAERERCAVIAEMGAKADGQTRDPEALMQELAVADYAAVIAQAIRSGE